MKILITCILTCFYLSSAGQSKSFIPLNYRYPDSILATPKTYVYGTDRTTIQRFMDITMVKKPGQVIVTKKNYSTIPIDSSIEINDRLVEDYIFDYYHNPEKATILEDSVYDNGLPFGEHHVVESFDSVLKVTWRSRFLKDTAIIWNKRKVKCLVIERTLSETTNNSNDVFSKYEKEKKSLYYFGEGIGIFRFVLAVESKPIVITLKAIKELKE